MLLYLIRHGIAEPYGSGPAPDDASRELTPKGQWRVRRNARALAKLGVRINEIWSSPLVRARRTAELLAEELGVAVPVRLVDSLRPDGDHLALTAELNERLEQLGVAVVGHEPDLGRLTGYLICGVRAAGVRFKKGGVACIEVFDLAPPKPSCQLRWLITPRLMALIAKS